VFLHQPAHLLAEGVKIHAAALGRPRWRPWRRVGSGPAPSAERRAGTRGRVESPGSPRSPTRTVGSLLPPRRTLRSSGGKDRSGSGAALAGDHINVRSRNPEVGPKARLIVSPSESAGSSRSRLPDPCSPGGTPSCARASACGSPSSRTGGWSRGGVAVSIWAETPSRPPGADTASVQRGSG